MPNIKEPGWKKTLAKGSKTPTMVELLRSLALGYSRRTIYPPQKTIFAALELCPLSKTNVVILGQDPYHGPEQANGLAFSVTSGQKIPPSLQNIYKEIASDTGSACVTNGDLTPWAEQGVLLLNACLTVEASEAGSHQGWGWEPFTDTIIKTVSDAQPSVVFMLWGKFAQSKMPLIDTTKHLVLTAAHPSPLSAHRGFLGCRHFSQANKYLEQHSIKPINW
jgi:uracil-DNA glycosylase